MASSACMHIYAPRCSSMRPHLCTSMHLHAAPPAACMQSTYTPAPTLSTKHLDYQRCKCHEVACVGQTMLTGRRPMSATAWVSLLTPVCTCRARALTGCV
eukprot:364840-Chlamydomonas_euryale.AAC.13